jgi:secreted trypsin-like serine protease
LLYTSRITNIRLPAPETIPAGPGSLSGWGSTGGNTAPNILQKAILSTISITTCRDAINSLNLNGDLVDYTNFCTGPLTGGLSACSGDSGGPLIQRVNNVDILVGIVSWGITPCGTRGAPSGVFKRVSAYHNWIRDNTGIVHIP